MPQGESKVMEKYYTAIVYYTNDERHIYESRNYTTIKKFVKRSQDSQDNLIKRIEIHKTSIPLDFYELWGLQIEPIEIFYDHETSKIMLIQRWWKKIFIKRKIARIIIKRHIIRALWNPYTILGKNRILREFNEFKSFFYKN